MPAARQRFLFIPQFLLTSKIFAISLVMIMDTGKLLQIFFANGYSPKEYEVVFVLVCSEAPSFDVFDLPPCRQHPRPLRNVEEAHESPKRT
ncbi:hypothetical protein ACFX1X_036341 [Malus domestica]